MATIKETAAKTKAAQKKLEQRTKNVFKTEPRPKKKPSVVSKKGTGKPKQIGKAKSVSKLKARPGSKRISSKVQSKGRTVKTAAGKKMASKSKASSNKTSRTTKDVKKRENR